MATTRVNFFDCNGEKLDINDFAFPMQTIHRPITGEYINSKDNERQYIIVKVWWSYDCVCNYMIKENTEYAQSRIL